MAPRHGRQHRLLARRLGARIGRGRVLVGADGGHLHQPRAMRGGRLRDRLGAGALHRVEALAAALGQDADQIDDDVGVARRGLDRAGMAQVGLHGVDLPDPAERLQMAGELRPAHRDADAVMALGERADHVAAEEARAAENGDERVVAGLDGHAALGRARVRAGGWRGGAAEYRIGRCCIGAGRRRSARPAAIDNPKPSPMSAPDAQVAELVDALVSGTSG